jgi:murein L,D-transpeptidase YcbB/YkuD
LRALASAEVALSLAAARYAWHAHGGRVDSSQLSLWLDQKPKAVDAAQVLQAILETGDAAAALRAYHPLHPQFKALRQAYLAESDPKTSEAARAMLPPGPRIELGESHPDVALVRRRLSLAATGAEETLYDRALADAVRSFMREAGYGRKKRYNIDEEVREALNRPSKSQTSARLTQLLVNMERWRWLTRNLGPLHVWNNLPEFQTRVIKNGDVIHEERIIIGETSTQTPIFSRRMTHVIFHPEWGVPESIKISSLLTSLKSGDTSVLSRRNMHISDGKQEISPKSIKWASVNIRDVPIMQRAGPGNPLGQLKFIFPNKHDVYMHDTPNKDLFNATVRTFSHGCIRVKNPQRFAEVILGEVKRLGPADVSSQLRQKSTVRLDLEEPVPVHNVYFTLLADASGTLKSLPDIYGHDRRIAAALDGKDVKIIAASDPALAQKRRNEELVKAAEASAAMAAAAREGEWGLWGAPDPINPETKAKTAASPFKGFFFSTPSQQQPRARASRKKTANR